jgi:cysteinyl-tRNA synthetase
MSTKYLGETFDIHGGGVDNIFPHNECEIAQAEAATGKPFARYWLLTGSLTVEGVKMSKSLNNFVSLRDALIRYRPEAIRFFILSGNYRSPLDYSEEAMQGASRGWERLVGGYPALVRRAAALPPQNTPISSAAYDLADTVRLRFRQAMDEDFNAPAAIAVLFDFTREVNTRLGSEKAPGQKDLEQYAAVYRELAGDVLGLLPKGDAGSQARESSLIQLLMALRNEARTRKDWALSDSIRDRLAEIGVLLEDGKEGTTWKVQ